MGDGLDDRLTGDPHRATVTVSGQPVTVRVSVSESQVGSGCAGFR